MAISAILLALALLVGPLQSATSQPGFLDLHAHAAEQVWFWPLIAFVIALSVWEGRKGYKAQGWPGVLLRLLLFVVAFVVASVCGFVLAYVGGLTLGALLSGN